MTREVALIASAHVSLNLLR